MLVIFDVLHLYYLPQYLPVHKLLKQNGITTRFVFYPSIHTDVIKNIIRDEQLDSIWVADEHQSAQFYLEQKADWIFFANAYSQLDLIHQVSKSAQLGHGIGPKTSYYTKSNTPMTVRFVEGQYRCERLEAMYPDDLFINVGFCKLDPIINNQETTINLKQIGLNPNKPTLIYAPTFYPSSIEKFAKDWPLDFKNFNILIKPHYFSISKKRYHKQKRLLDYWNSFDNVYLAKTSDYSLVPFMAVSDILISDASSALFEFAALNKPVVWCDFLKLRLSYRGPLSYRFKKRMDQDYGEYADIAVHAKSYPQLKKIVTEQLTMPKKLESIRLNLAEKLAGKLDGNASQRIVDFLIKFNGNVS